jgi:hypothetical protein
VAAVEQWKADMPTEAEMEPRDKYTIFARNERNYRKGGHSKLEPVAAAAAGKGADDGALQRCRSGPEFHSVSILPVSRGGKSRYNVHYETVLLQSSISHVFPMRYCASFGQCTISHIAAENLYRSPASLQTPATRPYIPFQRHSNTHARKASQIHNSTKPAITSPRPFPPNITPLII